MSALKLAPTGTRGPVASLFGVFDGHGGDGASKFVANHLHHLVSYSMYSQGNNHAAEHTYIQYLMFAGSAAPYICTSRWSRSIRSLQKERTSSGTYLYFLFLFLQQYACLFR